MTQQRWKVRWSGINGSGMWIASTEIGAFHYERFSTHKEALAYADRMARTVTVLLPRTSETCPVSDLRPLVKELDRVWVKPRRAGVDLQHHFTPRYEGSKVVNTKGMFIPSDHVKPLALALLAHHCKETV